MEHEPRRNEKGQSFGRPVAGRSPRPRQPRTAMAGRFATVAALDFSVIDRDRPAVRAAFARWLDPGHFAADGRQRRRLADLRSGAG
jgi:hypothetical protein